MEEGELVETLVRFKRRLAAREDESDSDTSSIGDLTENRGNKLRPGSRYVSRGTLGYTPNVHQREDQDEVGAAIYCKFTWLMYADF